MYRIKIRKIILYAVLLPIFALFLNGCGKTACITEIPLADGLPLWILDGEYTIAKLPADVGEQGLIGIYKTETDRADVYIYSFSKANDVSLEEFGQQQAAKHNIFCNMMTDRNVPVAVLNYHESDGNEHYIVQAYIYETDTDFIEVCSLFKTEPVSFGTVDLSINMIREYVAKKQKDSPLCFDTEYSTENVRLPLLHIKQFSADDFPADYIEPDLINSVSNEQFEALAEDGWTPEEIISVYNERYELLKGEVIYRNGLTIAFIGYIDDGIFKTRAAVINGNEYVMLCAEAEVSRFQHVTNALIDAIESN